MNIEALKSSIPDSLEDKKNRLEEIEKDIEQIDFYLKDLPNTEKASDVERKEKLKAMADKLRKEIFAIGGPEEERRNDNMDRIYSLYELDKVKIKRNGVEEEWKIAGPIREKNGEKFVPVTNKEREELGKGPAIIKLDSLIKRNLPEKEKEVDVFEIPNLKVLRSNGEMDEGWRAIREELGVEGEEDKVLVGKDNMTKVISKKDLIGWNM